MSADIISAKSCGGAFPDFFVFEGGGGARRCEKSEKSAGVNFEQSIMSHALEKHVPICTVAGPACVPIVCVLKQTRRRREHVPYIVNDH